MTTAQIAKWFASTRPVSQLEAVKLAEQVVIRRTLKPHPSDTISFSRLTPARSRPIRSPSCCFEAVADKCDFGG